MYIRHVLNVGMFYQIEISQHSRYTCTFCGKVRHTSSNSKYFGWPLTRIRIVGFRKTRRRRHLEVRIVQEGHRRWSMDCFDHSGRDCPQVCLRCIL